MIPSLSVATHVHSIYRQGADGFHRQVAPAGTPSVPVPQEPPRLDAADFAPADAGLDGRLHGLFDRLDADPAVQQALQDHGGPDGLDLPAFLRSGTAGALDFMASFGLRSALAGTFPGNPWVQSLSWFLAAAATVPLGIGTRRLTGVPPAVERAGVLDDAIPSAVFLGVNLLHMFGRHTKYPGGTLAGVAQALGLSALTGFAVVAARTAAGANSDNPVRTPQPVDEAMLHRALLMTPVAAMSLYVFSRSQRGLPLRAADRLGPLLLLSVVWCLRNHRPGGAGQPGNDG